MNKSLVSIMLLLICCSMVAAAPRNQQSPAYIPPTSAAPSPRPLEPQFPMQVPQDENPGLANKKALAAERNKQIQKETDQLLQLATELKKSVDAAVAGDALSVQAIKKTDEIEKLAKKVRSKMKESYENSAAH